MWNLTLLVVGLALVIKGADLVVEVASVFARKLRVSDLAIGLTVVAFGTSLPELSVNVLASIQGRAGIAIGNIIGSNIANVLLILGISGMLRPLAVTKGTVWKEIPLSLLAALLVTIMANDRFLDGTMTSGLARIDGLVLLCFFAVFLYYTASIARTVEGTERAVPQDARSPARMVALMVAGFAGLLLGSQWVVGSAVHLATALGVHETIVGLTIVAVGTSLPELATSAATAYRGNADIAIGNVVGSNIFNIFSILGVSAVIRPIPVEPRVNIDLAVLVIANSLLFLFMFTGRRRALDRWEAALLLTLYAAYIATLVFQAN